MSGRPHVMWTDTDVSKLLELQERGLSHGEMAAELNKSRTAIGQKLLRLGIRLEKSEVEKRKGIKPVDDSVPHPMSIRAYRSRKAAE